jgi:hypothetical protein
MATISKNTIILSSPKDWDEWLEIRRTIAKKAQIWEFVDPNRAPTPFEAPIRPTPDMVKGPGDTQLVAYSSLTTVEREEYKMLLDEFHYSRKIYDTQRQAIQDLWLNIQEHLQRDYLPLTFDCESTY